ncbi:unnamed protein product [Ectocarpus sp. CCAP 1310/34]|nr:unnamed protein product [Ectocarpus sp. CCAP 1310/34]
MLLARRRLLPSGRGRLAAPCCKLWLPDRRDAEASHVAQASREIRATRHLPRGHSFCTSTGTAGALSHRQLECECAFLGKARSVGGLRLFHGTSRAAAKAKLGRGARTETPAIPSFIEIRELASLLRVKPRALFKSMGGYQEKKKHRIVLSGVPYAFPNLGNVVVPFQDAQAVAKVLGKEIRFLDIEKKPQRAAILARSDDSRAPLWEEGRPAGQGRRPVVVLLGHFNHGKTTILDALRGPSSGIADREPGGITQEIRARTVSLEPTSGETAQNTNDDDGAASLRSRSAKVATILDTPGQEIFYRMRTNGARVADAVVLVVSVALCANFVLVSVSAAVDGVCLQTSESIGCAEELGLPAVVVLNKIDLLPNEVAAQRVKELSAEVREYVAIQDAKVLPLSAHTGFGLDNLRTSLADALNQSFPQKERVYPTMADLEGFGLQPGQSETFPDLGIPGVDPDPAPPVRPTESEVAVAAGVHSAEGGSAGGVEVVMAEAPEGAATGTVLDYTSSAKTGKMLLVLVDRGVLRPGDPFVSGMLWGFVRSIYDEEGDKLLEHAGSGVAAKVVIIARTRVSDAPLGEPFRVLTKEAAEQVAQVRLLARTIDNFVDHNKLDRGFAHLLRGDEDDDDLSHDGSDEDDQPGRPAEQPVGTGDDVDYSETTLKSTARSPEPSSRRRSNLEQQEELAPEDMPVTIVVKTDNANTLASVLDALGDWGDVDNSTENVGEQLAAEASDSNPEGVLERVRRKKPQEWREDDLQHKQRRRLLVSVAHSGVGAVTSSDVRLARDCECPVFAHNVRTDASATRELKRVGGGVVPALPEGAAAAVGEEVSVGIGGQEGFIGRAGEGRECVVVSETVGELLGEIERFVLRVR